MSMRCVVVPADTLVPEIKLLEEPLYKSAGREVGGYIEVVHPRFLPTPFCIIVNEEGLITGLPSNSVGSFWYGTGIHGWPIAGDLVVMKDGFTDGEPDIVGLTQEEADLVATMVKNIAAGK